MARNNFEGSPISDKGESSDTTSHQQTDNSSENEECDSFNDQRLQPNLSVPRLFATITNTNVLDCMICCEALAPPVHQCYSGHVACSSCCFKMMNTCPFCQMPIGHSRCWAFENVLESIILSCNNAVYGCEEALSYSKKSGHENTCIYAPFSCPIPDCAFFGSHEQFTVHLSIEHETPVKCFSYNSTRDILFKNKEKIIFLQEENEKNLFILSSMALNSGSIHVGNVMALNSIGSTFSDKEFTYELEIDDKKTPIKLFSQTNRSLILAKKTPVVGNLFVPVEYFSSDGMLKVKLKVWQDGTSPMHV